MPPSPVRQAAGPARLALLAALVVGVVGVVGSAAVVAPAAPVQASAGCRTEVAGLLGTSCDDESPPDTVNAVAVQSAPGQATVTAGHAYADADTDPVGFQCQVVGTATWGPCTISGLAAGVHQVAVRAVDVADEAIVRGCDRLLCSGPEEPDHDQTPATTSVTITVGAGGGGDGRPAPGPGGAPETQLSGGPQDRITPGAPVTLSASIRFELVASEAATFNCAVDVTKVPCHGGRNVLTHLQPGPGVLVAQAVTADGRFDTTPASLSFFVPTDVVAAQGAGWRRVASKGSYAGDYVATRQRGAVLTLPAVKRVRELRLLAPTGPRMGEVAVRVGSRPWRTVRLTSARREEVHVFVLRAAGSQRVSGKVRIKALRVPSGGVVAVDAVVAR